MNSASKQSTAITGIVTDVGHYLKSGLSVLRRGGTPLLLLYVASQAVITLAAIPLLGWLVSEALKAAGLVGIDMAHIGGVFDSPASLGLFATVLLLSYVLVLAQLLLLFVAVRRTRTGDGLHLRAVLTEVGSTARKFIRPGSIGLLPYLLILLPLAGFGFASALTSTIAVPEFITGELKKSTSGTVGYALFLLVMFVLVLRFALTIPVFLTARVSGAKASRLSWRLTRRSQIPLVLAVLALVIATTLAGALLLIVCVAPTAITDAVFAQASPVAATLGIAVAITAGTVISGAAVVVFAAILFECLERSIAKTPKVALTLETSIASTEHNNAPSKRATLTASAVLLAIAAGSGTLATPVMLQLAQHPDTLVLAHRGFSDLGVENTISGLDGARAAKSDLVEMDVMQTADGGFVAFHDATLGRLANLDVSIAELTLDEATAIEVQDQHGNRDTIPSLADYLAHAKQIEQQLLVEIKLHGSETDDFLDLFVAEMESADALEDHIYHSLDAPSVEGLKRMRPGLTVGYTMAFAGTALPQTAADFIVVEEWSYSGDLTAEAHRAGLGMFVWTVNDTNKIRQLLRDDVDGIITDHPDVAVEAREQMGADPGLASLLTDAILRFVTIL
ncbi:glycerophosphoryl diester phosphodiesterase membrane domain-containing protein [Leucobacter denitrificans]|uniref:Glycerophosphoryl diester phosphodiesterase membrane domain-containing protein n=1 Tax=Leucobacter denitrificans TaxID=683042 RepID=A0A7G9S479_9MICO|nr:glycerophosphoryl diester phosphodiesterase membrane domain-containing protein [Leucobacter denitrificans]QNN62654.1 glycerophosphoryl diester phosphodiesterase membrane domain-containing protein [Leucobacter denitrificans]